MTMEFLHPWTFHELDLGQDSTYYLGLICSHFHWRLWWYFEYPGIYVNSDSMSYSPQNIEVYSLQYTVTQINDQRSLCRRGITIVNTCCDIAGSFLWGIQPGLLSVSQKLNWVWKLDRGSWFFFETMGLSLPDCFCYHKWSSNSACKFSPRDATF